MQTVDIIICLGSSCFSRGNKKTVQLIENYIEKHCLADKVFFHGGHCFGHCDKGPVLKVNNKLFEKVDHLNVIDILSNELQHLLQQ